MKYRIKEILKNSKMQSKELAERLGKSAPYISAVIAGRQTVSVEMLQSIANALDVPIWQLFISPHDVVNNDVVAFFHYKGKSRTPETVAEIMTLLKEWKTDEFHQLCQEHNFAHIRKEYQQNLQVQQIMDDLCAIIGVDSNTELTNKKNNI